VNIVWMSWKDRSHPLAGGAEAVSGEIMDRLARDGHTVTLITSEYPGSLAEEKMNGVDVIRAGGKYSVYFKARRIYRNRQKETAELVIDEMNTIPFASALYVRAKSALLAYQLARKVWFYQMAFPLSVIGYLCEPIYLRVIARKYPTVLTESESTRQDMLRNGFKARQVRVFTIGMALKPLETLPEKAITENVVLSLGALRPMKRTLHAVQAFETARDNQPELRMVIAGDKSGPYARKVLRYIEDSRHSESITVLGRVSNEERLRLMREATVILVTSVKEGWGLIVTEANSQGTPAIVYDTDGLRDSVQNGKTGVLTPDGDPMAMGVAIAQLLQDDKVYSQLRQAAWQWSKQFSFEDSYHSFCREMGIVESTT